MQKLKQAFFCNNISRQRPTCCLPWLYCDLLRCEQSVLADSPDLYLTLPLPNPSRLPREVAGALALSVWQTKDAMYRWVTELKSTLWDSICSCFHAVNLRYLRHLPISLENKPFADPPYGVASYLKWEHCDRPIWFRKIDHFNGVKTISFNLLTFTLFYYWGVLVPASSHTPTQLLTHFGNIT